MESLEQKKLDIIQSFLLLQDMQVLLAIEDLLKESLQAEEIKNQISEEILQTYADRFREGFSFFFKENMGWNISYQDLGNGFLLLYFEGKEKEDFVEEIQQYEGDFEAILAEDEGDFSEVAKVIEEKGKAVLYLESSFFIVKKILEENWTEEEASKDCSEELGKILSKLP